MPSSPPTRARSAPNHAGFVVAAAVALTLLGAIVLVSKRLPEVVAGGSDATTPTTTGSVTKDPALSEPVKPPAR